jgi:hypothetical protein
MVSALRWLAIGPAVLAVWWLTILVGIGLLDVAIRYCPAEELVSGMCTASWYRYVEGAVIAGCAGFAAALIVAASAVMAPSHRLPVASVVLAGGIVIALYMALTTQEWSSFAAAVLAGAIAWLVVFWWLRKAGASGSVQPTPARGRG